MLLEPLLHQLQHQLLEAYHLHDRTQLETLCITFGTLVQASYSLQTPSLTDVLVQLEDAARDGMIGLETKTPIPTQAQISRAIVPVITI